MDWRMDWRMRLRIGIHGTAGQMATLFLAESALGGRHDVVERVWRSRREEKTRVIQIEARK